MVNYESSRQKSCLAITIGINQYDFFQPLLYAQRDAQALRDFLIGEAGFLPDSCLLLTDTSPAIHQHNTYPSRDNIQHYLTQICQEKLKPGDLLWFFFSGYGVKFEGKDYLLPAGSNPAQIPTTALAVETIFTWLQQAPTDNIVVMLDFNRSQSVSGWDGVGEQAAALADRLGIPTLMSCQPDQFSHETLALRQGLFTAALLEGMRYHGCVTLDSLANFLAERLPELSEHHLRPKQQPLMVLPTSQRYQFIVPEAAIAALGRSPAGVTAANTSFTGGQSPAPVPTSQSLIPYPTTSGAGAGANHVVFPAGHTGLYGNYGSDDMPPADGNVATGSGIQLSDPFWRRLITWGGILIAMLLLGVLLRNWRVWTGNAAPDMVLPDAGQSDGMLPDASDPAITGDGSLPPVPPAESFNVAPGSGGAGDDAGNNTENNNAAGTTGTSPAGGEGTPAAASQTGEAALAAAQAALNNQQYDEALRQLNQVPVEQQSERYAALRAQVERAIKPLEQANQALLDEARASLNRTRVSTPSNQASDFSRAIAIASQIQPGQPLHRQAQQDVERWSQVMLDMAIGRSKQRNGGAAQVAASNYRSAIAAARLVPLGVQAHAPSQQAIAQWSQAILDLAQARARDNRLDLAIQVAQQVPNGTPAYGTAQQAIATWQRQRAGG